MKKGKGEKYSYKNILKNSAADIHAARALNNVEACIYFSQLLITPIQYAYVIDNSLSKIIAKKGFYECLGYHDEDIDIDNIHDIICHEDRDKMYQIIKDAYEYGFSLSGINPFDIHFSVDYRVVKKDGSVIRVNRHSSALEVDKEGRMKSTLSLCTNITHLKQ
ncbi:MAG: PAS domain-containing protein, partial [Flavobacterium sp.]